MQVNQSSSKGKQYGHFNTSLLNELLFIKEALLNDEPFFWNLMIGSGQLKLLLPFNQTWIER